MTILQQGRTVYSGDIDSPGATGYRVAIEPAPAPEALAGLAAVATAERLPSGHFHVTLKADSGPGELSRLIFQQGWALTELTPEVLSLEQRYLQATSGEGA
ncbi:MAG: hypothetical protein P8178_19275 [Candidatus Thiodiazotropha sp.]